MARLGDDFTVFAVVDYDSGMLLRVERYAKTTGPEIVAHMERLAMEWGNPEFLMDHTAHQAYIGDFAPRYLRVTGMKIYDREKERLVLNLKFLLQVSRLRVPDPDRFSFRSDAERDAVRELVKEVTQFQKVVNSQGQVRYSAPSGGHDDCLTAWYLAVDPIARDMKGKLDGEKVRSKVAAVL
ncbi:hypothetical protein GC173_08085 [bacterium]|nr:hypothetical protein [bacterium]